MNYDEALTKVQRATGVSSREEAQQLALAFLRTLGERLSGGETFDLASQLPLHLAEALPPLGSGEPFGVQEFYRRLAHRTGTDEQTAALHTRALMSLLREAVTGTAYAHVLAQLPQEYADLATGPAARE
ncbi:conserved hypothetical protein [Kribbella flavida DSM 17836]|uniref:DUF2267 domain-containing protein n=1 Tax=Kribbella flavida (strain DSM 17836 / JCM 10339 / NBRC 14399) TaxID=479435 RepID=D2PRS8_KRIFD|nr:DUF2267 domain-containing protein [Kribbella flavida]ADB29258.1 conserved hypothetical protein [Kribbella flavida DSM 17836]